MAITIDIRCRCGTVTGRVAGASRAAVNRVVCYCDDCQAFAHHLGRADLLDLHGGSDIIQVAPAALSFARGTQQIAGMRLAPAGLFRFYATCCNTPLGNLVGTRIPFIGVVAQAFERPDDTVGAPIGRIYGKYARGTPPGGSARASLRVFARAIVMVLGWKVTGRTWPHPFFERGASVPRYPVRTLSTAEREALRPLCGPRPAQDAGVTVAPPGSLR